MELTPEILREALRRYDEIQMSKVPKKEDLHYEYSKRFERKMRRLIRRVDTPVRYHLQKAASIVLVLATLLSGYVIFTTEAGAEFRGWLKEQCDTLVHYFFEGEPSSEIIPKDMEYRPFWLPDGYKEYAVHENETGIMVIYKNELGISIRFRYSWDFENRRIFINEEEMISHPVKVNEISATMYEPMDDSQYPAIIWNNKENTSIFLITGDLTEDELVKIAESVSEN